MNTKPVTTDLARLLHDLSLREGADLERALADAAVMFSRLGASAAPRLVPGDRLGRGVLSLAHAEFELAGLILREVERLCEQASRALDGSAESAPLRRDLSELLFEELDCAQSMDCLQPSLLGLLRDLGHQLPRGSCEAAEFSRAAVTLREAMAAAKFS